MADSQEPVAVGKVLKAALGEARYGQLKRQLALYNSWAEIAGPLLGQHVRPVAILGGVLWLEADTPPFAQEAQLRSAQLMEAVNRLLGADSVSEVRIAKGRTKPLGHPLRQTPDKT